MNMVEIIIDPNVHTARWIKENEKVEMLLLLLIKVRIPEELYKEFAKEFRDVLVNDIQKWFARIRYMKDMFFEK